MDSPNNGGEESPIAYGKVWMQRVIDELEKREIPFVELRGDEAVRKNVENEVVENDPSLFVSFGHGLSNIKTGQFIDGQFDINLAIPGEAIELPGFTTQIDNADQFGRGVVHLISCHTAKELGPKIAENAQGYAGYSDELIWIVEDPSNPEEDKYAEPFGRVATQFAVSLAQGKTVGEAKQDTIDVIDEEVKRWESPPESNDLKSREVVKWLLYDKEVFEVMGDESVQALEKMPVVEEDSLISKVESTLREDRYVQAGVAAGGVAAAVGLIWYFKQRG